MKIDWKHVSQSPGYKSLKAAYIRDVTDAGKRKNPMRDKAEFLKHFNWVINRAKHYAHKKGVTIDVILNKWEEDRSYWWLNYYQESKQPKLGNAPQLPYSFRRLKAEYKRSFRHSKTRAKHRICDHIKRLQREASTKSPARWPNHRKKYAARRRKSVS